ncbi:MAG: PilZ domain-containing protein [Bdellovibrionaceae bacterium]|nr:PilZ domain-containing protein [Bdellovibrionales bacterium]MCB9253457.1 PilZ domain-containing protein [Pseudobdellovibrionaceae bacterium]
MTDQNNNQPKERRRFRRIPVTMSVGIFIEGQPVAVDGEIANISLGGAFIRTKAHLKVGSKVQIELKFKENLLIGGKVVNANDLDIQEPGQKQQASVVRWVEEGSGMGFGVEFDNLDPKKQAAIQKIVRYYDLLLKAGVQFKD